MVILNPHPAILSSENFSSIGRIIRKQRTWSIVHLCFLFSISLEKCDLLGQAYNHPRRCHMLCRINLQHQNIRMRFSKLCQLHLSYHLVDQVDELHALQDLYQVAHKACRCPMHRSGTSGISGTSGAPGASSEGKRDRVDVKSPRSCCKLQ